MKKQINFKNLKIKYVVSLAVLVCALVTAHFLQNFGFAEANKIVYSVYLVGETVDSSLSSLYKMNSDGTYEETITTPKVGQFDFSPAWSPDGSKIAFIREYFNITSKDLYVVDADGKNETLLFEDGRISDPTWSPDGSKIAFVNGNDPTFMGEYFTGCTNKTSYIATIPANGGRVRFFADTLYGNDPSWSPSGTQIAFAKAGANGGIFSVNTSNGVVSQLIYEPSTPADPEWSFDGTKIVYGKSYYENPICYDGIMSTGGTPTPNIPYGGQIIVKNLATGTSDTLVSQGGSNPEWSPNDFQILFSSSQTSVLELFKVNSSGGTPSQVMNTHTWEFSSSWSY